MSVVMVIVQRRPQLVVPVRDAASVASAVARSALMMIITLCADTRGRVPVMTLPVCARRRRGGLQPGDHLHGRPPVRPGEMIARGTGEKASYHSW
jgi:hypothetical protein